MHIINLVNVHTLY